MLDDFKRQRLILEYQLRRVISSGSSHDILNTKAQEFTIIKDTYMYFKIPVVGQLAPAKLFIRYEEGTYVRPVENIKTVREKGLARTHGKTKVELTAYYSTTNKEPNKENNMKVSESPQHCIMLISNNKDKFEGDSVYLSLFSFTGCKVTMKVVFQEQYQNKIKGLRLGGGDDVRYDEEDFKQFIVSKQYERFLAENLRTSITAPDFIK